MTQIKILVNNIHDVTHRAATETELNVYLKMGWKVHETHQHMDADDASLMLTTILTKEGDDGAKTESSEQETVKQSEDKNPVLKTKQQNTVKGSEKEKEKTKEGTEENKDTSTTSTEEPDSKEERSEAPKGFKKKDDSQSSEQEKESSKASADKTETKETKESETDEIEPFNAEEKTTGKK
ncbi:MAG: hypothetical protein ABIP51_16510 [Bacteroidia bacterium]